MRRGTWATRLGIYLAAIGSAFGMGSLWRFPYVVAENGGGAFVILYFLLIILIGVPLLIGELMIGKVTRRSVISAQKQITAQVVSKTQKKGFILRILPSASIVSVIVCSLILGYYSVISGWVLYYLVQFASLPFVLGGELQIAEGLVKLRESGSLQMILSTTHLLAVLVIVAKGVEEGIEKWVGFIIPIFVGILAVLISRSAFMEQNADVWRYFFYPDLTRLNFDSLSAAIGQVCFTLSIGFGTMITFGSYLRDDAKVSGTGFRVVTMDSLTAIISGFLIFPLIGEAMRGEAGPELLFRTVPGFLLKFEGGKVFGIFFFICLYLAALGASISLLETVVANMTENSKFGRGRASLLGGLGCLVASIPAAFSSTIFAGVRVGDRGLLQSMDYYLINWLVPALALIFCLVSTYKVSEKWQRDEFLAGEDDEHSGRILFTHWNFLMRWVIPPLIILSLIMQVVALVT